MKRTLVASFLLASISAAPLLAADKNLKTVEQQASYTLGTDLAKNFEQQGVEIDIKALVMGMEDVMNKKQLRLTEKEMQDSVMAVKEQVLAKQAEKQKKIAQANAKKGEAFLAANKKKDGVKVTKSGLQYKVINDGKGASPTDEDYITAHYRGTLIDGTEFDSSYGRGTPLEFQTGDVIPGWGEALKMMKPGAQWEVYIPARLAYGSKGAGDIIGPNETLIFNIELIKVDKEKPNRG